MTQFRIILHGTRKVAEMAQVADESIRRGRPDSNLIGVKLGEDYFSVAWNQNSVSVWLNEK